MLLLLWELPSGRTTHAWAMPSLRMLGMWNIRLPPLLPHTGDLTRQHRLPERERRRREREKSVWRFKMTLD